MILGFSLYTYYRAKINHIRTQGIPQFSIQLLYNLYSFGKAGFSTIRHWRPTSEYGYYTTQPTRRYVFYIPVYLISEVSGGC